MNVMQRFLLCFIGCYGMATGVHVSSEHHDKNTVHVRFAKDTDVTSPTLLALPSELSNSVESVSPLFTLDIKTLKELHSLAPDLPDMSLWHKVDLKKHKETKNHGEKLLAHLIQLDHVDVAEFAPRVQELPSVTPQYGHLQGYLDPAPSGIGAKHSHTIPGGDGEGIKVTDVEYEWETLHEDLDRAHNIKLLVNKDDTPGTTRWGNDHGTAVLGELIGTKDAMGVTGVCPAAKIGMAPAVTKRLGFNPANAILLATVFSKAGDVILIEQQANTCGKGYGPQEVISSVFEAIQTATAKGVTVVEAAGNGNVNLDDSGCNGLFNRDKRDSGAIIVGAGGPAGRSSRARLYFSSYGSRVDVQGWGQGVATTGYGNLFKNPDNTADKRRWYTGTFSGTSSASPIVAGAVANIQGVAKRELGKPLDPKTVRDILKETGSPQQGKTSENIGPLPDLEKAIQKVLEMKTGGTTCTSKNNSVHCDYWAAQGYCKHSYVAWMNVNCKKSCTCKKPCTNKYRPEKKCEYWEGRGFCDQTSRYMAWMIQNCKKACGKCDSS